MQIFLFEFVKITSEKNSFISFILIFYKKFYGKGFDRMFLKPN